MRLSCLVVLVIFVQFGMASERVSLNDFCMRYGFPDPVLTVDSVKYQSAYTEMVFKRDSRMMHFNGVLVWMLAGAESSRREWKISAADRDLFFLPLLRSGDFAKKRRSPRLVLIDPGHGGSQKGAKTSSNVYEKDLVLDISRRVRDKLDKFGIRVALTRDRDLDLSLDGRSRMIGELGADLFISVHLNSAGNLNASGIETYIVPPKGYSSTSGRAASTVRVVGNHHDALNALLGYILQRDLLKMTGAQDRGLKRARFDVIAGAACPAVLLECGFMSNSAELKKLQTVHYRELIAEGIAEGVRNYYLLWEKK